MLPEPARQRLRSHITALAPFDISWTPPGGTERTASIDPTVTWAFQGDVDDPDAYYPVVALDFATTSVERPTDTPLDEIVKREAVPGDSTVAVREYQGAKLYDELTVYVEVARDHGDIPQRVIAQELAARVWYEYRFNADYLNTQGGDHEWPMLVRPQNAGGPMRTTPVTTGTSRNDNVDETVGTVETFELAFRVNYTAAVRVERAAVDSIEWTVIIRAQDGTELATTSGSTDVS